MYTKPTKTKRRVFYFLGFSGILLVLLLFVVNYFFTNRKTDIEFLSSHQDNPAIEKKLRFELDQNLENLVDFLFFDKKLITKLLKDDFPSVNKVNLRLSPYFSNFSDFGFHLKVVVVLNDNYFVGCIQEKDRGDFLVFAMQGNSDGEFYKEVGERECTQSGLLKLILHPKSLYAKDTEELLKDADSLSGSRVYKSRDFAILKEILTYLQNNGFEIRKAYVNQLKLVDIDVTNYLLKISLEEDSAETINDFKLISRTGKLEEYINHRRNEIEYIDLSYKDKVFFRLRQGVFGRGSQFE